MLLPLENEVEAIDLREVAARRRLFFIAGRGWGQEVRTPFAFLALASRDLPGLCDQAI
jgi:hypothetical protein